MYMYIYLYIYRVNPRRERMNSPIAPAARDCRSSTCGGGGKPNIYIHIYPSIHLAIHLSIYTYDISVSGAGAKGCTVRYIYTYIGVARHILTRISIYLYIYICLYI